jgi:hypothetical protein
LYNRLFALVSEANFDRDYEPTYKTIKELEGKLYELSHQLTEERVKCVELKQEIDSLRSAKDNKMLSMMEGLSEDEVKEVEDKMSIFVRAIKSRVYSYA